MRDMNIRRENGAYASAGALYAAISLEKKRDAGWMLHAKIVFRMGSGKRYMAAGQSFAEADYGSMESAREAASQWCCEELHEISGGALEIIEEIRGGW